DHAPSIERGPGTSQEGAKDLFSGPLHGRRGPSGVTGWSNGYSSRSKPRAKKAPGQPSLFDFRPQADPVESGAEPQVLDGSFPPAPKTEPRANQGKSTLDRSPSPSDLSQAPPLGSGEKAKARDIISAIRTLKSIEEEKRPATQEERNALIRFCG